MDPFASTTATTAQTEPQLGRYETLALRNACEYERLTRTLSVIIVDGTAWYKPIHRDVEVMLTGFMCC